MPAKSSAKTLLPFIVSLAMFMEAVDTNVINTAIPVMAKSFDVNPINLKVALISYLLSLAIFIPISGWVADKFGIKRVFITAITVFTISSLWCGFAITLPELICARILQGLGGSLMLPVGRLIILKNFARHELIVMMSRVVMVGAFGLMLGPVLGGFITQHFSWRWIFWINIPVGILNVLMCLIWLPKSPKEKVPPLDIMGFIYFGTGLSAFVFSLSEFSESTASLVTATMIFFAAILLFIAYYVHSRGRQHQIVKMSLFETSTFRIAAFGNLVSRLGFSGIPFLIPLLLQIPLGYSAQTSGLVIAPMAIGILLIKPLALPLLRYFGFKRLLIINTFLVALMLWGFNQIQAQTSLYFIGSLMFLFGFLVSLQFSAMNSLSFSDLAAENLSAATSIMGTLQQLAQSFGVALGALCLRIFSGNFASLSVPVFHYTFATMALVTLLSAFIFKRLKQGDGHGMLKAAEEVIVK